MKNIIGNIFNIDDTNTALRAENLTIDHPLRPKLCKKSSNVLLPTHKWFRYYHRHPRSEPTYSISDLNEVIFYAQTTLTYVEPPPPLDPQKIKR